MEITIERYIEQVIAGKIYKGYFTINGVRLIYEVNIILPIGPKQPRRGKLTFELKLSKGTLVIMLTDKEREFFLSFLRSFITEFYTHDINLVLRNMVTHESAPIMNTSFGVVSTGICDLTAETCFMLTDPKFGCALLPLPDESAQ